MSVQLAAANIDQFAQTAMYLRQTLNPGKEALPNQFGFNNPRSGKQKFGFPFLILAKPVNYTSKDAP
jgi:hypothetical protein